MEQNKMQYNEMQYNDMQYNRNRYGGNIDTELLGWLKTLSKREELFITKKIKKEPVLTKKELERWILFEKENAEICGYDGFEQYVADIFFDENLNISLACKRVNNNTLRNTSRGKYNPNEKITCSCGKTYTKTNKSRHFKTWHSE